MFVRQIPSGSTETVGVTVLKSRGVFPKARWYWIGVGANIGYVILFNFLVILALTYLNRKYYHSNTLQHYMINYLMKQINPERKIKPDAAFGKPQAILSKETIEERNTIKRDQKVGFSSRRKSTSGELNYHNAFDIPMVNLVRTSDIKVHSAGVEDHVNGNLSRVDSISRENPNRKKGMILPFEPLSITFDDIHYSVDMPQVQPLFT